MFLDFMCKFNEIETLSNGTGDINWEMGNGI